MPIRLRLAVAFALAAAALFALGGWLFASGLSSARLKTMAARDVAQSIDEYVEIARTEAGLSASITAKGSRSSVVRYSPVCGAIGASVAPRGNEQAQATTSASRRWSRPPESVPPR